MALLSWPGKDQPLASLLARMADAVTVHANSTNVAIGLGAAAAVASSFLAAPGARGVIGAALALVMLAIAVIDARSFIIPDELTAAGAALAVAQAAVQDMQPVAEALAFAALRGAVLALIFLAIRVAYNRLRGRQGLGLGDVKLAGVAGALLDWVTIPFVIEIAALSALSYYIVQQIVLKRPVRAKSRLPFGLYLAPAIWLGWLFEATLLTPF